MVSSVVAYYTGDWRWGLRIAPLLNTAAIILMVFFCGDPPRGESDFEATEGRKSDVEVKARIRTTQTEAIIPIIMCFLSRYLVETEIFDI